MCKEQTYDIVFMDHMMPGMDGVETMKRIRYDAGKHHRDFPIVALTANALSTAREMFIAEGFDGFISKPIELAELERVLRHVLSKTLITYVDENEDALGTVNSKLISENETDDAWFVYQNGDTNTENTSTTNDTVSDTQNNGLDDSISLAPLADYGIDINLGLKYCQDGEIYMSLLEQYAQEFDEKLESMEDFYKKKDLENYTILVHALKSTSLMIGDKSLSEEAKALELAGKNRDLEFIEKNHRAMTEHYTRTAQGIAKVLKVKDTDEDDFEILEFPPEG